MKVNSTRDISFKSIYTNKAVKKGLELASDNGTVFGAAATVAFSAVRPISIWVTPKTDKENRKLAAFKSITSSLIGFCLALGITFPFAKSLKKIDKNPEKYLSQETIKKITDSQNNITNSKGYVFITQIIKLGLGALIAVPKSILTADGIPYLMNEFDKVNDKRLSSRNPSFKSNWSEKLAKNIGKQIDKKGTQSFIKKYKDTNFPMHIVAISDIISTVTFAERINTGKKIEESRKKTLIYNSVISTVLSILSGYIIDSALNKPTEKFIKKFKELNKYDKNLQKQIQGIRIAKPLCILGVMYYTIIPVISTFLAEKADNKNLMNR